MCSKITFWGEEQRSLKAALCMIIAPKLNPVHVVFGATCPIAIFADGGTWLFDVAFANGAWVSINDRSKTVKVAKSSQSGSNGEYATYFDFKTNIETKILYVNNVSNRPTFFRTSSPRGVSLLNPKNPQLGIRHDTIAVFDYMESLIHMMDYAFDRGPLTSDCQSTLERILSTQRHRKKIESPQLDDVLPRLKREILLDKERVNWRQK